MDTHLLSNIQKLFSERIDIFSPVEFNKVRPRGHPHVSKGPPGPCVPKVPKLPTFLAVTCPWGPGGPQELMSRTRER